MGGRASVYMSTQSAKQMRKPMKRCFNDSDGKQAHSPTLDCICSVKLSSLGSFESDFFSLLKLDPFLGDSAGLASSSSPSFF